jgi:XXXCH domain-containing protein
MASEGNFCLEVRVPAGEAAAFFRWLGDGLAAGRLERDGVRTDLAGCAKLRLAVDPEPDGSLDVSLKIKYPKNHPAPAAPGRPAARAAAKAGPAAATGYKALKKRMGKSFRAVRSALEAGAEPGAGDVRAYLDDGRRMCTFPGKGDPMYPGFLSALDRFEAALAAGDAAGALRLAGEMQRMKKECHARFK